MFFKLVPWSSFKLLAIAMFTISIATSTTGLYVLSISKSLSDSLAVSDGWLVIYSSISKTPHTGLVVDLSNYLSSVEGIELTSPEVLTPATVGSTMFFVRGVNFTVLKLSTNISLTGSWPKSSNEAMVGYRLSRYLGISVDDSLVITGIPTGREVRVVIKAIYASGTPLDDELLCDLSLARDLRGIQGNYITLIRVKLNKSLTNIRIPELISGSRSISIPSNMLSDLRVVQGSSEILDDVLGRSVKISSNFLWSSILLVLITSVLTIYHGILWTLNNLTNLVNSLRFIGLNRVKLLLILLSKTLVISLTSGFLGYLLSYSVLNIAFDLLNPRILLHSVELTGNYLITLTSTLMPTLITTASIVIKARDLRWGL